jgi:hypothetical protein
MGGCTSKAVHIHSNNPLAVHYPDELPPSTQTAPPQYTAQSKPCAVLYITLGQLVNNPQVTSARTLLRQRHSIPQSQGHIPNPVPIP